MSQRPAAPPDGSPDRPDRSAPRAPLRSPQRSPLRSPPGIVSFVQQTLAIAEIEVRKLRRDYTELLTRAVQPTLWLLVFGQVFSRIRGIPTGSMSYLEFMTPGILAQSVLFTAIFYGIGVIWERDLGVLQKLLVSPAYRSALVLGKGVSAGVRGLSQALIVYLLALLMRIPLRLGPGSVLGVAAIVALGAAVFSTFSLLIACIVKTRERFMGIGQVLTMPLFFASNAIYPVDMMPPWLRVIAAGNPLSFLVDALRAMMIHGAASAHGLAVDFGVLLAVLVVLTMLTARLYPTVA
ncbi:MAG: ABC transporter permease [Byssovorax sp.]